MTRRLHHVGDPNTDHLEARRIRVEFAGLTAVDDVDLRLHKGEILGLIGPNGAGKTTLVNAITGFQAPRSGSVLLEGVDVTGWSSSRLARAGLVRTFQGIRIFPQLTVFENVEIGSLSSNGRRDVARETTRAILRSLDLEKLHSQEAGSLAYGNQRRVELARAIAMGPAYLMLDEPAAGLSEGESDELMRFIAEFRAASGAGVLIIEHDMRVIMNLCSRIHVLDFGCTIKVGTPAQVRGAAEVIAAYLGAED